MRTIIALIALSGSASAHESPTGWKYPFNCCGNQDCRQIDGVSERPGGYVIDGTGEILGYHDPRLRDSPDGLFHWCSEGGQDGTKTICLFVPPRGY